MFRNISMQIVNKKRYFTNENENINNNNINFKSHTKFWVKNIHYVLRNIITEIQAFHYL